MFSTKKEFEAFDLLRGTMELTPTNFFVTIYAALVGKNEKLQYPTNELELKSFVETVLSQENIAVIKNYLEQTIDSVITVEALKRLENINPEELLEILLNYKMEGNKYGENTTPQSILNFIPEIFSISERDKAADFCSGYGHSILTLLNEGAKNITSIEINYDATVIQEIKKKLSTQWDTFEIFNEDIFDYSLNHKEDKFDYIFAHIPWGVRMKTSDLNWTTKLISSDFNRLTSEWIFLSLVMSHLKKKGKAIVTVPNGIDFSSTNSDVRREFIQNGFIEKIIQLPSNLYYNTSIPSLLMVLSFGNESIEFIDGSDTSTMEGRRNIFTEEDVKTVMSKDFAFRAKVFKDKVLENERLLPSFYTVTQISNYVELKDIAKIIRGQNFLRNDLDQIIANEVTGIELIRTSNINDHFISNTQNLTELPERYVEALNRDLLITRVGSSKSVTIYEEVGSQSIIDQSLLIIRMKDNNVKMDPYYVLGFLLSDLGEEQLSTAYSSGGISQISIKNLEKIKIPIINEEEQMKIAYKTKESIRKIKELKFELDFSLEMLDENSNKFFERGL